MTKKIALNLKSKFKINYKKEIKVLGRTNKIKLFKLNKSIFQALNFNNNSNLKKILLIIKIKKFNSLMNRTFLKSKI